MAVDAVEMKHLVDVLDQVQSQYAATRRSMMVFRARLDRVGSIVDHVETVLGDIDKKYDGLLERVRAVSVDCEETKKMCELIETLDQR
jgi:hypothetical protein